MPLKMKFAEGEKVFCFHGPLIYEAKCVKAEMKDKINRYFIHYNGWNSKWDEWVPENRILKSNDASIQKQRELQKAHHANQLKVKAAKKREKEEKKEKEHKDKGSTPIAEKSEPGSSTSQTKPTSSTSQSKLASSTSQAKLASSASVSQTKPASSMNVSQTKPPPSTSVSQTKPPPSSSQIKPTTPAATPSRGRGRPSNAAKAEAAKAATHPVTSTPPPVSTKDKLEKDTERAPDVVVKNKTVDSSTVKTKSVDVSSAKSKPIDTGSTKTKYVDTSLTKNKVGDAGSVKSKTLETSSKIKSVEASSVKVKTEPQAGNITNKAKVADTVQSKTKPTEPSTHKPKAVSEASAIKTKTHDTPSASKDVEPVTSADISSQSSIGSASTVSSISEQPRRKRPRTETTPESDITFQMKSEFKINIPESLKQWLVDDWDLITRQRYLVSLPSKNTVDNILDEYVIEKSESITATNETKGMALEVTQGIREYFNVMLGTQLLYKFERPQYSDILSEQPEMKMERIYGAPHLLRLFVKLGGMLAYIALDEKSIELLLSHLQDFLDYMQKNVNKLFTADNYIVASPEYHRKALCY